MAILYYWYNTLLYPNSMNNCRTEKKIYRNFQFIVGTLCLHIKYFNNDNFQARVDR